MGDESEWKKLPTEEKVEHKNWKARVEGYEECIKQFQLADDPKNPIYLNYLGLVKKFVVDTNEIAREKALDAVLAYIENIPAAAKSAGEVLPGLINKCLNGRAKTKEKAIEIIMMFIEIEKQESVLEELIKGLDNKQPKIVQSCCETLRKGLNEFGSKVVLIKPIIKNIPKLLEDRDKSVRDEAKLMAVEMYRWAGAAIMSQFQNLKPVLMQELEDEFKKLSESGEKARQTRFLRSQQDLKAKMEAEMQQTGDTANGVESSNGAVNGDDGGDGNDAAAVDPYDLLDPVDIIPRLPKDFKEKIEAKKWQERKEALDALQTLLTQNPKLAANGDYHELVTDLKKIVAKDANIVVATLAAKCIGCLASGLRKEFSKYSLTCLEPLCDRFKEKKQNVVDTVREALDAIYRSTNLDAISETIMPFLAHKTPVVRQQVALFLCKCFAMSTQTSLPKKTLKLYLPPLIKNLSEADPDVRNANADAIGALYKALGEKAVAPLLAEVEPAKVEKIKECADKCVLLNAKGEPRVASTAPVVANKSAPAKSATTDTKKPPVVKGGGGGTASAKPAEAAAAKKPEASAPAAKKVVKGGGGDKKGQTPAVEKEEPDLSQETVDEKSIELFTADICTALGNSNWKERQQSVESIMNAIKRMPSDEIPAQIVTRLIAKKPGLKDTHFQVLKQKFDIIMYLAQEAKFTQRSTQYCIADIADKIGDVKNSQQSKDTLSKIAEAIGLPQVLAIVSSSLFESKNPKNQENGILWIGQSIKEFGSTGVDLKALIAYLKGSLQNSNASVRSASIQLIGTLYMYFGANIRVLFESEKPALLEQIDNEIAKNKDQKPSAPIRFKKGSQKKATNDDGDGDNGDDEGEQNGTSAAAAAEQDLLPRVDISSQITDELIVQLNDKNWKERQAALEKLEQILKDAKFIHANLGELPTHLNKRLNDTNKNLSTTALKIAEKLAESMGIQGKKYCSSLATGMIQALSDNKEALRKQAIATLNAWFTNCGGLTPFLEGETLVESFATANPNLKAELCGWLASVLPKSKKLPPELKAIIGPVYTCLEDRSQDVRVQAQALIEPLMAHVGPNEMLRVMQKAKASSVTVIQPIVEKARADLAAKQAAAAPPPPAATSTVVKQAPSKTTASTKAPVKTTTTYDDDSGDDEPAPQVEAPKKAAAKEKEKEKAKSATAKKKPDSKTSTTTSKKKNGDDEDLSPALTISNKNKRVDDEKSLKTLKWNFDVPRKEFVEQLKQQFETCVNRTLLTQLFHDDFKHHINALTTLIKSIEELPDATISNLDLILKWLTLRFFETNPTVIVKAIEYMQSLFNMLASKGHMLLDFEANSFIPYFVTKLGDPKDPIRKGFRQIVKQIAQVYTPSKVFNFLILGLASKNARQRAECLEELGQMIEAVGLNSFNPQVTLKEMAKQIADRDTSVRNAALNAITIAFQISGEYVFKCIGKLNDKDQSMLDERIKRTARSTAPSTAKSVNGSVNASIPHSISQSSSHTSITAMAQTNVSVANVSNGSGGSSSTVVLNNHNSSNDDDHDVKPGKRTSTANATKDARVSSTPKPTLQRGFTQPIIRPKGEFTLDIKDDDDDKEIAPVKLEPHKDLDELLSQPVSLPPRKNVTTYPSNILKDSQDCKEAIDLVITHISHQQMDISFQYLLQIDVVIKDRDKKDLLQPHIDNLLKTCAVKLNVVHNVYMTSSDCKVDECFRLLKGLFMVILDVFEFDLGKFCDVKTLKELIYSLLCVMIDPKVNNLPDSDQLIKANNMVTLKVLELSEQTNSYCALVKLLTDCCSIETLSNKFLELVMKCIWRQIRRLSSSENLVNQLNTSKVLNEIHMFLKLYPSNSWSSKVSDLPLRTIKTLLYHLAKARQYKILQDLENIEHPEESEIKSYINKLFKNGFQLAPNGNNNSNLSTNNSPSLISKPVNGHNGEAAKVLNGGENALSSMSPEKAKQIGDQLSVIFKKITSSEQSKQGLEDLYDFKINNPEIDLTKYLKKSTDTFQKFIEDGLKRVSNERSQKENLENRQITNTNGFNGNNNNNGSNSNLYHSSITTPSLNLITPSSSTALTSNNVNRNVEDIMKTIADWKSKTHLNKDQSDDDFLRTRKEPDNTIKADRYLDIVRDLKKKYTRARTESDQLNDLKQLDLKSIASKGSGDSPAISTSNSNLDGANTDSLLNNQTQANKVSTENLYDEYKRRLELIKKIKPIK